MRRAASWAIIVLAAVAAPAAEPRLTNDWRKVATPPDKARLLTWRSALVTALASATKDGEADAIAREGALLLPDAGIERPAIPAGDYICRTVKLGRKGTYTKAFSARPASPCLIGEHNGQLRLTTTGSRQRTRGNLFPANEWRQIFLGTLSLGDETRSMDYGRDGARDMAGVLERIAAQRWRIILPAPAFESLVDVIEIVPAN